MSKFQTEISHILKAATFDFGCQLLTSVLLFLIFAMLFFFAGQVVGAHFEKSGSKAFAVYTIKVTDADNRSWQVQRRSGYN